jgi:hypothetical protein
MNGLYLDRIYEWFMRRSDLWMVYTAIGFMNGLQPDRIYEWFTHRSNLLAVSPPIIFNSNSARNDDQGHCLNW